MTLKSTLENMTIDELALHVQQASVHSPNYVFAARLLAQKHFTHKSRIVSELESELRAIYEKYPQTRPF